MTKQIGNPSAPDAVFNPMPLVSQPDDPTSANRRPDEVPELSARDSVSNEEFESLLMETLEPAYRLALRLTGNSEDAQDLVQEAALRASRFRHSFQKGTTFKSWFYRIIVNQFYTATRRRKNTTSTSLDALTDATDIFLYARSAEAGLLRPDADPAANVVTHMAEEDVGRALAALPEEFRAVATLYFIDDLSYQEIAEILGVPIGTVRSRLHRARHMLQKQLWRVAQDMGIVPAPALTGGDA
jgi:RNA polymerase sigma-70 factor (ECF subfamily)